MVVAYLLLKCGDFKGQAVDASTNLKQFRWSLKLPHIFFNARLASFCSVQAIRTCSAAGVEALSRYEEQPAYVKQALHT
jgi:hypothetical protein